MERFLGGHEKYASPSEVKRMFSSKRLSLLLTNCVEDSTSKRVGDVSNIRQLVTKREKKNLRYSLSLYHLQLELVVAACGHDTKCIIN